MPRSYNQRSRNLLIHEVLCRYCGAELEAGRKFCDRQCYSQKRQGQSLEQRFWSKVDRSGDCWVWTASRWNSGYGQFAVVSSRRGFKAIGAHVMSYVLANGPIPEGLEIMHACDNRLCVRPDHLSVGTHTENVQDASRKGRLNVSRPNKQKLTAFQVQQVRSLVAAGWRRIRVAEYFGISKTQVTLLMRRQLAFSACCGTSGASYWRRLP
jgi:hypothetical protein